MKRGLRVMGHPAHAMLSDFPMVLLLAWAGLDLAGFARGSAAIWAMGTWALILGLASAGVAAVAGFIDYLAVFENRPQATRTATAHLLVMLSAVSLAGVALLYRPPAPPEGTGRVLDILALGLTALLLGAGGWFGGHLVFHHGVGQSSDSQR